MSRPYEPQYGAGPNEYGTYNTYGNDVPLQFYGTGNSAEAAYGSSNTYIDGSMGSAAPPGAGFAGQIQGGFWSAFTPNGYADEPPLLEELGISFEHIKLKSMAVLNPIKTPDARIMDDADLAGPLLFCFCFAMFLLLSGKPQFGYIYGVGLMGTLSIYALLNLMSPTGIDAYRTASVLGYCLLPLVLMSLMSVLISMDGFIGYIFSVLSILWCAYSASGIFVSVLHMSEQRALVAYPIGLLYTTFAILTVFDATTGNLGAKM